VSDFSMSRDVGKAAASASPAVSVAGAVIGGLSLQDWVLVATLVYLVLQIAYLAAKWVREAMARRARHVLALAAAEAEEPGR